jgi:hypothetical protein
LRRPIRYWVFRFLLISINRPLNIEERHTAT